MSRKPEKWQSCVLHERLKSVEFPERLKALFVAAFRSYPSLEEQMDYKEKEKWELEQICISEWQIT